MNAPSNAPSLDDLQARLHRNPDDVEAWLFVAIHWRAHGRNDLAIEGYTQAAQILAREGFLLEALTACQAIFHLDPDHTEAQRLIAELYARHPDALTPPPQEPSAGPDPLEVLFERADPPTESMDESDLFVLTPDQVIAEIGDDDILDQRIIDDDADGVPVIELDLDDAMGFDDPETLENAQVPAAALLNTQQMTSLQRKTLLEQADALDTMSYPERALKRAVTLSRGIAALKRPSKPADAASSPSPASSNNEATVMRPNPLLAMFQQGDSAPLADAPTTSASTTPAPEPVSHDEATVMRPNPLLAFQPSPAAPAQPPAPSSPFDSQGPTSHDQATRAVQALKRPKPQDASASSSHPKPAPRPASASSSHPKPMPQPASASASYPKPVPRPASASSSHPKPVPSPASASSSYPKPVPLQPPPNMSSSGAHALHGPASSSGLGVSGYTSRPPVDRATSQAPAPAPQQPQRPRNDVPETPLFSRLSRQAFVSLARHMTLRRAPRGAMILGPDARPQSLFVIVAGMVRVIAKRQADDTLHEIARMGRGEFFGEFYLLTGRPNEAMVQALEDVDVLELRREVIHEIARHDPEIWNVLWEFYYERLLNNLMARSELFGALPTPERNSLASRFQRFDFSAGQQIVYEGAPGGGLYLILRGSAVAHRHDVGPLATLREGDFFGTISSLMDTPATSTVQASTDITVLLLSRDDLIRTARAFRPVAEALKAIAKRRRALIGQTHYQRFGIVK